MPEFGEPLTSGHLHRRAEAIGRLTGGVDPGGQGEQRIDVAIDQRHVIDFGVGDDLAERRLRGLDHGYVGRDFDGVVDRADLQAGIGLGVAVDLQHDAGLLELLEPGRGDLDAVGADRQEQQRVGAVGLRGDVRVRFVCEVGGGHLGRGRSPRRSGQ